MSLKPCPFCSGPNTAKAEIMHRPGCFMLLQAMPKPGTTSMILLEAWNTRYEPAARERDAAVSLLREARTFLDPEHPVTRNLRDRIDATLKNVTP